MKAHVLAAAFVLATASLAALASPPPGDTPVVDKRQAEQQQRIRAGIKSGTLTPREVARLEREQAAIARAEARAKSDGVVTKKERAHLRAMQDHASADIHRQKHDAQTVPRP